MSPTAPPRRRAAARPLALAGAAAFAAAALAACQPKGQPPSPTPEALAPEAYGQAVGAFFSGLDGLDAGDTPTAEARFRRVTELAPGEPAAWANLALAQLRQNNPAGAETSLARARELAPADGDIALLAALVKSREGAGEGALAALREAVAVAPGMLRARYALAQELIRVGDAESQAGARAELEAILAAAPANQVVLVELARLAARMGDTAAVDTAVGRLAERAAGWSAEAQAALAAARAGGEARARGQKLAVLANLLLAEPGYQADMAEIQAPANEVGRPLRAFLALAAPPATAAEPDRGLTFKTAPLPEAGQGAWAVPVAEDAPPVLATLVEGRISLAGEPGVALEVPAPPGSEQPVLGPSGVAAVDWNNDRRPDLAIANGGGLRLHQQGEGGAWVDVTGSSGLPPEVLSPSPGYTGVWPVDVDLDADLDLVLGQLRGPVPVLRNNGDGSWTPETPLPGEAGVTDLAWADFDGDGDPDIATLGAGTADGGAEDGALVVFVNERSGLYRPVQLGRRQAAVTVADQDGDGRLDVLTLSRDGAVVRYSPDAAGEWAADPVLTTDLTVPAGSMRLLAADMDLNGATDLVASDGGQTAVLLAIADAGYAALPEPLELAATSLGDLDGDGRMDLAGSADGSGAALRNLPGDKAYHFQVIRPKAQTVGDQRVNSFGVGGQMTLRSGLLRQTQPIAGPAVHFGLGEAAAADSVRIQWPNGVSQAEFGVQADQAVVAEQRLKGSCPWLFADDGGGQKFVTDILWKSPLGLRINAQDTAGVAQTLDWVKVRGEQLAARDGRYELAITAELWETHYFDHVGLLAVDHPAGTEILLDERFVIPPPPAAITVTGPLHPVTGATDHRGRDVTAAIAARDGAYLDGFALGSYQGLAEDHWVTLELGPAVDAALAEARAAGVASPRLVLAGFGWLYPTDSSINVALGQGGLPPPAGLALEVPDGQGGWTAARVNQGFPAGKQKTSLLDLSGLDPAGGPAPRQLRLRTNLEIYWDSLAVAARRPDLGPRVQTLAPARAELRYRGFSATNYTDGPGPAQRPAPEIPDYDRLLAASPLWLDLVGYYTRFGDVKPLLAAVDDRYVILNAGDEIALSFPAPAGPPAGEVRDFVFVSDGWEKDGDFNTAYSETVQPLPSHDRPEYADPIESGPVGPLAADPVYRRFPQDWLDYHTRYVGPRPAGAVAGGR